MTSGKRHSQSQMWHLTPKIDRAIWPLNFLNSTCVIGISDRGGRDSDMGHILFLNSTCDIGKISRDAIFLLLWDFLLFFFYGKNGISIQNCMKVYQILFNSMIHYFASY